MLFSNLILYNQYLDGSNYTEKINTPIVSSIGTYYNPDDYYKFLIINEERDDKQYVYDLYADNKYFGEEEYKAEKAIIKELAIPVKDNFMDYYE